MRPQRLKKNSVYPQVTPPQVKVEPSWVNLFRNAPTHHFLCNLVNQRILTTRSIYNDSFLLELEICNLERFRLQVDFFHWLRRFYSQRVNIVFQASQFLNVNSILSPLFILDFYFILIVVERHKTSLLFLLGLVTIVERFANVLKLKICALLQFCSFGNIVSRLKFAAR